jgi:RHS repeat-associated protein
MAPIRNGTTIVVHSTWRGLYTASTDAAGDFTTCHPSGPLPPGCTEFDWPGRAYSAWLQSRASRTRIWYGSLVLDQRDETGLSYRRNRYYDSETGQFTQQDPIGIAGGLNLYGYANGDPINFSDPFGLRPCDPPDDPECEESLIELEITFGAMAGVTATVGGIGVALEGRFGPVGSITMADEATLTAGDEFSFMGAIAYPGGAVGIACDARNAGACQGAGSVLSGDGVGHEAEFRDRFNGKTQLRISVGGGFGVRARSDAIGRRLWHQATATQDMQRCVGMAIGLAPVPCR